MREQRVLCVSFDRMVSDSRCAALREAGLNVTATTSVNEALDLLSREKFDLVIVGHRFPREEKYLLTVEAEKKSDTPVLVVRGAVSDSDIPASARVYALEGIPGLMAAVSALLPEGTGGASPRAA
jgi:DNA-binding response OmpR family regulator